VESSPSVTFTTYVAPGASVWNGQNETAVAPTAQIPPPARPAQVSNPSSETWNVPVHGPEALCLVKVSVSIGTVEVIEKPVVIATLIAPSRGLTASAPPAGATQTAPLQDPLAQSAGTRHVRPFAHVPHVAPPQSTSVSVPFRMRSSHAGAGAAQTCPAQTRLAHCAPVRHSTQTPSAHAPFAQSDAPEQARPVPHCPHEGPPQSTSLSSPFATRSSHAGAAHAPAAQTWLAQSSPERHWTQAPFPSHIVPLSVHAVRGGACSTPQAPATQLRALHSP
jgi:hypothetical protein